MDRPTSNEPDITLEQVEKIACESAADVLRRYSAAALVGFLVLVAGLAYAISQTADIDDLDARTVSTCERINILRAQSNVSDAVSFTVISQDASRVLAVAASRGPEYERILRDSAASLRTQAKRLTVTPLTDCNDARSPRFRYPLSGPIGDPQTGELFPGVKEIVRQSESIKSPSGVRGGGPTGP